MIKQHYSGSARRSVNIIWNAAQSYGFDPPFLAFFANGQPDDYLNMILKIDKDLTASYELMKRYYYFNHYWYEYSKDDALQYIEKYIDECFALQLPSFEKLANTLDNWKEEIANSFIPYKKHNGETVRLSNGKIEGKNSYIKKMIRLANGYSNFERFRNRAMYCENYYETYSKEPLKNAVKRKFPNRKNRS